MPRVSAPEDRASDTELFAKIAVPVPLFDALTYEVPEQWRGLAKRGHRARVRVGKRRLTGVILETTNLRPTTFQVRPLDEILDLSPVVDSPLLELAEFVASYYVSPIGEVVRALVPNDLQSWGSRKVRVTSRGALSLPIDPDDLALLRHLVESGSRNLATLSTELGLADLPVRVARLEEQGKVTVEATGRSAQGHRYLSAIELPKGELSEQLERCGRSPKARAAVEFLAQLERPATLKEILSEVGCTGSVIQRLVKIGLLRRFTQIERLGLERHVLNQPTETPAAITLRADQQSAVDAVISGIDGERFAAFLLSGMTGSGKTEVYLRAAERVLAQGRSVILLVPEIALVPALARTVKARFGEQVALLHSNLSNSERQQEWERIRAGQARVVLGPRSAVFAPLDNVGLIVVDEEHDGAYKQEIVPRYNGRDIALVRARNANAVAVLASATPSLETRNNVERQRYAELHLTERAGQGSLPEGVLVDLRKENLVRRAGEVYFSERLNQEITRTIEAGDQVILLRNRRGYAPVLLCRACGEDHRCDDCGLPMTFHKKFQRLVCHYCGTRISAPSKCKACGEQALEPIGTGTERVEEDFRKMFPGVSLDVLDRDTARQHGGAAAVLERFGAGRSQVLIGTQMVSKGHHFPNVVLTAVLSADSYLGFPDFRAVEKTYCLLTQLAGRAGRGERPGKVVIQTFNPDHYAIRAALNHDDEGFALEETRFRRTFHYPPFSRMVQLVTRDKKRERAEARIQELAAEIERRTDRGQVRVNGPAPAPLERLRGQWRFQLLVRTPTARLLRQLITDIVLPRTGSDLVIDVDPYDLM